VQILIPIPQYPLYSATIPMLGGTQLKYYLVRIALIIFIVFIFLFCSK